MLSNTSYISHFNGNSTQTVFNERNSFIYPHSVKVVNGQYVENNIPVRADEMYNALGIIPIVRKYVVTLLFLKIISDCVKFHFHIRSRNPCWQRHRSSRFLWL